MGRKPRRFTTIEGGVWLKFSDNLCADIESYLSERDEDSIVIYDDHFASCGVRVHSIEFDDNTRWDCIKGFE